LIQKSVTRFAKEENDMEICCPLQRNKENTIVATTKHFTGCGDRLGIYFFGNWCWYQGSKVVYDRANSAYCGNRDKTP